MRNFEDKKYRKEFAIYNWFVFNNKYHFMFRKDIEKMVVVIGDL